MIEKLISSMVALGIFFVSIGSLHGIIVSTDLELKGEASLQTDTVDEKIREIAKTLKHVAIVPDGNRRWAKERDLPPIEGHKEGGRSAPILFGYLWRLGIHTTTLSLISNETWNRSPREIEYLMDLSQQFLMSILPIAKERYVKMVHLGRKDRLPQFLLETIQHVEGVTSQFNQHIFNFCIDYGSMDEVTRACQKLVAQGLGSNEITKEKLASVFDNGNQPYPNPDLFIRTGKVSRTSGFMSLQLGYSELYFPDKYFPDFNVQDLKEAILEFGSRKRTFGK